MYQYVWMLPQNWEKEFFGIVRQENPVVSKEECNSESSNPVLELPQSRIKSYWEAILALEDVQLFLGSHGHLQDTIQMGSIMDNLSATQIRNAKKNKTTLHGFII